MFVYVKWVFHKHSKLASSCVLPEERKAKRRNYLEKGKFETLVFDGRKFSLWHLKWTMWPLWAVQQTKVPLLNKTTTPEQNSFTPIMWLSRPDPLLRSFANQLFVMSQRARELFPASCDSTATWILLLKGRSISFGRRRSDCGAQSTDGRQVGVSSQNETGRSLLFLFLPSRAVARCASCFPQKRGDADCFCNAGKIDFALEVPLTKLSRCHKGFCKVMKMHLWSSFFFL